MRILFPIHGIGVGVGSEDYMLGVARGLASRGHEVILVAPRGSQVIDWDTKRIVFSRKTPAPLPILWRVWYPIAVAHQIAAAAMLKAPEHDVVVTGLLPALLGRALRTPGRPRVYLTQSPLAWFEILSYGKPTLALRMGAVIYNWLQAWAWKRSAAVCSYTPQLTDARTRWFGSTPRRVIESPPGIDFDTFAPGPSQEDLLKEFGIPESTPIVISFCRLIESKDVAFLLRSFARPQIPPDSHLLVLGAGSEMDNLRTLAAELGLTNRVHFAGFKEHVADYLRLGHVYAFPSRLESFGLTLAQAMACGLPAVARRHRFPEVLTFSESMIDEGDTGLLVNSENEMATALASLLNDRDGREAMGRTAAAAIRSRFRWDHHLDALESALRDVTEAKVDPL